MSKLTYSFHVEAVISMHVEVKATSIAEAIEKAQSASAISLCHQCARSHPGEWSTSGEIDCDPATCKLVDVMVEDDSLGPEGLAEVQREWGAT